MEKCISVPHDRKTKFCFPSHEKKIFWLRKVLNKIYEHNESQNSQLLIGYKYSAAFFFEIKNNTFEDCLSLIDYAYHFLVAYIYACTWVHSPCKSVSHDSVQHGLHTICYD